MELGMVGARTMRAISDRDLSVDHLQEDKGDQQTPRPLQPQIPTSFLHQWNGATRHLATLDPTLHLPRQRLLLNNLTSSHPHFIRNWFRNAICSHPIHPQTPKPEISSTRS